MYTNAAGMANPRLEHLRDGDEPGTTLDQHTAQNQNHSQDHPAPGEKAVPPARTPLSEPAIASPPASPTSSLLAMAAPVAVSLLPQAIRQIMPPPQPLDDNPLRDLPLPQYPRPAASGLTVVPRSAMQTRDLSQQQLEPQAPEAPEAGPEPGTQAFVPVPVSTPAPAPAASPAVPAPVYTPPAPVQIPAAQFQSLDGPKELEPAAQTTVPVGVVLPPPVPVAAPVPQPDPAPAPPPWQDPNDDGGASSRYDGITSGSDWFQDRALFMQDAMDVGLSGGGGADVRGGLSQGAIGYANEMTLANTPWQDSYEIWPSQNSSQLAGPPAELAPVPVPAPAPTPIELAGPPAELAPPIIAPAPLPELPPLAAAPAPVSDAPPLGFGADPEVPSTPPPALPEPPPGDIIQLPPVVITGPATQQFTDPLGNQIVTQGDTFTLTTPDGEASVLVTGVAGLQALLAAVPGAVNELLDGTLQIGSAAAGEAGDTLRLVGKLGGTRELTGLGLLLASPDAGHADRILPLGDSARLFFADGSAVGQLQRLAADGNWHTTTVQVTLDQYQGRSMLTDEQRAALGAPITTPLPPSVPPGTPGYLPPPNDPSNNGTPGFDGSAPVMPGTTELPAAPPLSPEDLIIERNRAEQQRFRDALIDEMKAANPDFDPTGYHAHHILPLEQFPDLNDLRSDLAAWGIDLNNPANGLLLPGKEGIGNGETPHSQTRGADYKQEIKDRFEGVTTREEALAVLDKIKNDLRHNTFFKK
jgi:A nuclease family of the HNH/ENDO VII superfamily with conserved AHH